MGEKNNNIEGISKSHIGEEIDFISDNENDE